MLQRSIHRINYGCLLLVVLLTGGIASCKKDTYVGRDPYAGAKEPLDITINKTAASPAGGKPGTVVTITGRGFARYKDSGMVVKFNDVQGEITEVKDSILKVKVPSLASSGLITVTVLRQVFPGPFFSVRGPIYIDSLFHSVPGANGRINCISFIPGGQYLIGGSFVDYDNSGLVNGYHGVARINADGSLDRTFKIGKGIQGSVSALAVQADGKYILGGNFSNYNERFEPGAISNIMRLNSDGSADSLVVDNQDGNKDTIPALNAYFDGSVSRILQEPESGKLVVIGNFTLYMSKDFTIATADGLRDSVKIDTIRMEGIVRLNEDGTFDSTFNYNTATHSGYAGTNGPVLDALVQNDGKVILAGNFTKYRDQPANRVVRLNTDGSMDPAFNVGSGPDNAVLSIAPLQDGGYVIAGMFNSVDGKENRKIAVLGKNGSPDNSFSTGTGPTAGPDGIVYNAVELRNGKLFIGGSFDHFSTLKRNGTVVLNKDGSISEDFNNLGAMELPLITQILPVPNTDAVILVGAFTKYDLQTVNHIAVLKY